MGASESKSQFIQTENEIGFLQNNEKLLYDNLKIGLIILRNNQIIYANQRILTLLEYERDSFIGLKLTDLSPLRQPNGRLSSEILDNALISVAIASEEILAWIFNTKNDGNVKCDLYFSLVLNKDKEEILSQVEIHEHVPKKLTNKKLKEKNKLIELLNEERESLNEELRATLDELVSVNSQLSESETWNKSIVDNIPLGLMVINKGDIEYVNDKLVEILKYSENEIKNKSIFGFALPEEKDKIEKFYSDFLNDKPVTNLEVWIRTKDNKKKYIRNQHVKLKEGRWMIIASDLTNEKNKETEVITANERLEFAIETNKTLIWDIDLAGEPGSSIDNTGKLISYKAGNLVIDLDKWTRMIHPDDVQVVMNELSSHFYDNNPFYEAECRIKTETGDWRWVLTRGKLFNIDEKGNPTRFIGLFIDISRLKATEEILKEAESRFRTVITNASVLFFSISNEGYFILSQGKGLSTLGLQAGEFEGLHISEIDKNFTEFIEAINRALKGDSFTDVINMKQLVFEAHISPVFDDQGAVKTIVGVLNDITDKQQAELKLKQSEEKFRTIIQHLSDIILVVDNKGNILYESPSVSRTFGYEPGDLVGKNGFKYIHPDDVQIAISQLKKAIEKKNEYQPYEIRIKHKTKRWVCVELLGDNLSDHPSIGGVLLTGHDITEHKENMKQLSLFRDHLKQLVQQRTEEIEKINAELISANEELSATNEELAVKNEVLNEEIIKRIETQSLLEESENKFRSFIEQSTEGITLIDESGYIVDWNKGMESIFRISRENVIGTPVWEFDYRLLPKNRKKPEDFEELKDSIISYLSDIDHNKVMTVEGPYLTMELKQKYLNVTIFPVITPKKKYVGRIFRDVTGIRRAQEEIQKQSEELKIINEDLETQKSKLENTLNELKKTQAQLIHSEKMASLGVLTAGVAHEINNPVNYISSALEGLKITLSDLIKIFKQYEKINKANVIEKIIEIEKLKKSLDYSLLQKGIKVLINNMQTGIERITEIVKSLRTFAHNEENELKRSNIHELIDTTLVMLHNQYKNRIEIIKKYGNIPEINCYPGKLNQVFMNLLSNAIQAIHNKGQITIVTKIRTESSELIISISDTGVGMTEDIQKKIFEPFFTTKEAGKGIGLGLSITYGIIQQHQGKIDVKSQKDKGSEFTINLPIDLK